MKFPIKGPFAEEAPARIPYLSIPTVDANSGLSDGNANPLISLGYPM
jgi:hypothetical protein